MCRAKVAQSVVYRRRESRGPWSRVAVGERKETRTSAVSFPLGPYHPALSEPYALRLRLRGERVVAATEPVYGYGRRGVLEMIVGQPLDDALVLLERACAHTGQAYRLALSIAVERAGRLTTPPDAQLARVFFAELEMALSALWTLSEIARTLNLPALRTRGLGQRERIFAAVGEATGERVYWGVARPGGVREGIRFGSARAILDWLPEIVESWRVATAPQGALRRAAERLEAERTKERPVAPESAGAADAAPTVGREDARRVNPYGGYRLITLDWSSLDDGHVTATDVAAWALRLATRLKLSADIMRVCAESLDDEEPGRATTPVTAGVGSVTVQTAHGPARLDVTLASDLRIAQLRLATPCAAALAEAPQWLLGRRLAHVPAILAGLDLCPSCAEL